MKKTHIRTLQQLKRKEEKIVCLTAYDASFARIASECGVEVLLVGDSLGMVVQGQRDTVPVSVADMVYHTRAVCRGNQGAFVVSDLPFLSYASPEQACKSARKLMQAGAEMVKLEGGHWLKDTVDLLVERGVPVCAHLGLLPQSVHALGGYRQQATSDEAARVLVEDAEVLVEAGAQLLVVECIPGVLAGELSKRLSVPVIGIGAGGLCDGQVLVLYDMLGLSVSSPSFSFNFLEGCDGVSQAIESYVRAVKEGSFPK